MFRILKRSRLTVGVMTALALLIVGVLPTSAAGAAPFDVQIIAAELNNPRGLSFGPLGGLYVAEAGRGGEGPCVEGPEGPMCFGYTGSITKIWNGQQARIVEGLPSLAAPDGSGATGPSDVSVRLPGVVNSVIGLGFDPAVRQDPNMLAGVGELLGYLGVSGWHGQWHETFDVAGFETVANPDGEAIDSNPYAILRVPGGNVVADAGANALLSVENTGVISTVAVFPSRLVDAPPFLGLPPGSQIPMQSVPTSVVTGPDGAYYVGELTGFPFPVDAARVYRVVPGEAPEIFAAGFTNIIDLAFDPAGNLFVLEIATNGLLSEDPTGALIAVQPDGTQEVLMSDGLIVPAGLAIGSDGAFYVSNCGACPAGAGHVLRIMPEAGEK